MNIENALNIRAEQPITTSGKCGRHRRQWPELTAAGGRAVSATGFDGRATLIYSDGI